MYALSATLRDAIARDGDAMLHLDLAPGRELARLHRDLAKPRAGRSLSEHLRRQSGLTGVKAALLYEVLDRDNATTGTARERDQSLPLRLPRPRPLDEAISSAGGVRFEALDEGLMLRALPGVFCAGEMLDWEAPTGGYLLTACFASGYVPGAQPRRGSPTGRSFPADSGPASRNHRHVPDRIVWRRRESPRSCCRNRRVHFGQRASVRPASVSA